jgi:hypothetical protein
MSFVYPAPVRPDSMYLLCSKAGFHERVRAWADGIRARLLAPEDLLATF